MGDSRRSATEVADRRIAAWIDLVHDLVTHPTNSFPRTLLLRELFETFDSWVCSSWFEPGLRAGMDSHLPIPGWPPADILEQMCAAAIDHNPWVRWHSASDDPRPMTTSRVPKALVTATGRAIEREFLRPAGIDQQLYIPYSIGRARLRLFALGRTGADFPAEDLERARQIQPLLRLLDRHFRTLREAPNIANQSGLTGREIAVIQLLADGLTATTIAGRLAISSRTVHRHLGNLYRKLGVTDRVRAVLVAEEAGLLRVTSSGNGASVASLTGETGRR